MIALTTTDPAWWLILAVLFIGLAIGLADAAIRNVLDVVRDWIYRRQQQKRADAQWADLLAAVGLTPKDMRRRWAERDAA